MKNIKLIIAAIVLTCTHLFITSCDEVSSPSIKVDLGEFPFIIPLDLENENPASDLKSASAELVSFSGKSAPINLDNEMFNKLNAYEYSSVVFIVSDVKVKITVSDNSGTIVKDFTATATGNGDKFTYKKEGNIDLGTEYSDAQLTKYMKDVFAAIQNNKTMVIDVSGQTDIVPSEIEGATLTVATIIPTISAEIQLLK